MTWSEFSAMLADLACHPGIILVCALVGLAAAAWAGYLARGAGPRHEDTSEAGDTQANWPTRL